MGKNKHCTCFSKFLDGYRGICLTKRSSLSLSAMVIFKRICIWKYSYLSIIFINLLLSINRTLKRCDCDRYTTSAWSFLKITFDWGYSEVCRVIDILIGKLLLTAVIWPIHLYQKSKRIICNIIVSVCLLEKNLRPTWGWTNSVLFSCTNHTNYSTLWL